MKAISWLSSFIVYYDIDIMINMPKIYTNTPGQQHAPKNIMEFKAITNLDELTGDASKYNIWVLRLKSALKLVNQNYGSLLGFIEQIEKAAVSHESWQKEQLTAVIQSQSSKCTAEEIQIMSKELYSVLIDKCTDAQVTTFENEQANGLFAFNQVNSLMTRTAGIGGLERREYISNPTVATKDSEVYGLIMAWEKEIKNQERHCQKSIARWAC